MSIKRLFEKADLRCTVCDAPMGACDCWQKCHCGWSYRKNGSCENPAHGGKAGLHEATHVARGLKP